jgi:GNAT superfamily N-acetyltransferase
MRFDVLPYTHPDVAALIEEIQRDLAVRYGGPDETPVTPADFAPPRGLFLVAYLDGAPAGCGGWRSRGTDAELKRLYTVPAARRTGVARAVLAELERTARAAGHTRLILETGTRQPEAIALYSAAGYTEVPPFGHYADSPESVYLGKTLTAG